MQDQNIKSYGFFNELDMKKSKRIRKNKKRAHPKMKKKRAYSLFNTL